MKPIVLAPLVALALAGALLAACAGSASDSSTPTVPPEANTPTQPPGGVGGGAATVVPPPTPSSPSADWLTHVDPVLGFTLDYPPDLTFTDLTSPGGGGLNQRALEFRSAENPSRAFVVSVSENTKRLTLEQWAIEFAACQPKSIRPGTLGGIAAILCTREVIEGSPGPAALAEKTGKIFLISGQLTDSEFAGIAESFRF